MNKDFWPGFWGIILKPRCPACHNAGLFHHFFAFLKNCPSCGFEYTRWVTDDGPAFVVLSVLCTVIVPLAIWVEVAYEPPLWVHAVAWFLAIMVGTVLMLRPVKAAWIYCQWYFRAHMTKQEKKDQE